MSEVKKWKAIRKWIETVREIVQRDSTKPTRNGVIITGLVGELLADYDSMVRRIRVLEKFEAEIAGLFPVKSPSDPQTTHRLIQSILDLRNERDTLRCNIELLTIVPLAPHPLKGQDA